MRALLLREELDIVDQQQIDGPELVAEARHSVVAQRVDHLVGEFLARYVADGGLRLTPLHFMTNRMHEVRLAHPDSSVQEERVIGL